jgi:hypothetical protein
MIKRLIVLQVSLLIAVVIQMNPAAAEPKPDLESACYDAGSFPFMLAADGSESEKAAPSPSPTPPKKEECRAPALRPCSDVCGGVFGMLCAPRTVCNPSTHRCENEPGRR